MISALLGGGAQAIGKSVKDVSEVFRPNATRAMELEHQTFAGVLSQYGQEFVLPNATWFDSFVNGLNRLPRPMMALGTMGLFGFAMVDPIAFSARMQGLSYVPEPLWWLLGAIVSFYFGARELHYARRNIPFRPTPPQPEPVAQPVPEPEMVNRPARRQPKPRAPVVLTTPVSDTQRRLDQAPKPARPLRPNTENAALDAWRAGFSGR
ncbi:MAG: 3TM-type holin [Pseudomonadota bacterium]